MANNRIYYAIQQVGFHKHTDGSGGTYAAASGVQSVGITTNFNLEQVFELGQLAIYENIEEIPDVEVTLNKVLDGTPLLFHLATQDSTTTGPTLANRSNARTFFAMSIFPDTGDSATGNEESMVECSGMFSSSVGYNFPLDDNFSEDLTLVGNDKIWKSDPKILNTDTAARSTALSFPGQFVTNTDSPNSSSGVDRRQDLLLGIGNNADSGLDVNGMSADPDLTVLPPDVFGITTSGTNEKPGDIYGAHLQSITVSADLGREPINELGRRLPYHRPVSFPLEVSCEITVTSISGDMVSATEVGIYTTGTACGSDAGNLQDRTIRIATCEGTRVYLGTKNKLSSVNYSGGDAGGGNVAVSYSFITFNDFTVLNELDPHASAADWWAARGDYLVDLV